MIKDVVVEAIIREEIAAVVDCVDGPVLAKFLRAKNEDAVVSEFVVLDDR